MNGSLLRLSGPANAAMASAEPIVVGEQVEAFGGTPGMARQQLGFGMQRQVPVEGGAGIGEQFASNTQRIVRTVGPASTPRTGPDLPARRGGLFQYRDGDAPAGEVDGTRRGRRHPRR